MAVGACFIAATVVRVNSNNNACIIDYSYRRVREREREDGEKFFNIPACINGLNGITVWRVAFEAARGVEKLFISFLLPYTIKTRISFFVSSFILCAFIKLLLEGKYSAANTLTGFMRQFIFLFGSIRDFIDKRRPLLFCESAFFWQCQFRFYSPRHGQWSRAAGFNLQIKMWAWPACHYGQYYTALDK